MTATQTVLAAAIDRSQSHDEVVTVTATNFAEALAELGRLWDGDIDHVRENDGALDVWGWTAETAEGEQDWRLRIERPRHVTVLVAPDADRDDCLAAAAEDVADRLELAGYDMDPTWADDDREQIALTIPGHAAEMAERKGLEIAHEVRS